MGYRKYRLAIRDKAYLPGKGLEPGGVYTETKDAAEWWFLVQQLRWMAPVSGASRWTLGYRRSDGRLAAMSFVWTEFVDEVPQV